jgi:secretion/DNA translocation related TadE-like protein
MSSSRSERGAATFVMLGVLTVVISLAVAGMLLGAYVVAVHQARVGADLAALSGAAAFEQGGAACRTAGRTAGENHVDLITCDQVGDQLDFVVTARVRVSVGRSLPGLPRSVEAIAYAGADSE